MLRAAATDGHRLARFELELPDGAADMPGVIVPRKTVTELRRLLDDADGAIEVSLSDTKIQFTFGGVELTSKLIDGTFPDYQRVIPSGNDKVAVARRQGVRAERRPRLDDLRRQDARGEAQHREGQGDVVGGQSGNRHGDRRTRRQLQRRRRSRSASTRAICSTSPTRSRARKCASCFPMRARPRIIEDTEDTRTLYVLMPMRV